MRVKAAVLAALFVFLRWHFTDSEKNLYSIAKSVSPGPAP